MALHDRAALQEFPRRQAGKRDEFANQVWLIKIAAIERQLRPVERLVLLRQGQGALKSPYAAENLRRHAHLRREERDQAAMAELDFRGHAFHARVCLEQPAQSNPHLVARTWR